MLHDKRTLELELNEALEEITRSRRQRHDQPVNHVAGIRIWTGSEERSFHNMHPDVQEANRYLLARHLLTAQRRITSCIRNGRAERCEVRGDDERVACSLCIGGRMPCIE
jgi:hypothetical protein